MDLWPWHLSSAKSWPPSGTTLKTGIAQLIARAAQFGVTVRWNRAPGVRVSSAPFTGRAHIESLSADLTGAEVRIDGDRLAREEGEWIPDPDHDEVHTRTPGEIAELRLRADPVTFVGREARADVALTNVPVDWVVVNRDGGLLGTVMLRDDVAKRLRGSFRFSMAQEDIAAVILSLSEEVMKGKARWAAAAKALKISVTETTAGRFTATIGGKVRVFFLPLSARVGFDLSVTTDGEITVHRAAATSKSLLSRLMLLPLRPDLQELAGTTTRITDDFRVSNFAVDAADDRLSVSGDLHAR
ncbi:MAG: hypothetical protein ACTH3U_10770 [Microbacterium gubbeenense]|uniref:hypothetical protein n=1 Tax=Microbacterium gubbeenense TaxID=159896 RepID=UPI003F9CC2A6